MLDLKNNHITYKLGDSRPEPDVLFCVDVDKTMTETDDKWRARFQSHCVAPVPHRPVAHNEVSIVWDHFEGICQPCFVDCLESPTILLAHDPDPLALDVMRSLVQYGIRGLSIGFHAVTARPEKAIEPTLNWFLKTGYHEILRAVTFTENKRPIVESLGARAHIDDSYGIYRSMTEPTPSPVEMIFLLSTLNKKDPVERIYRDWKEVESRLRQIAHETKVEHVA